LTGVIPEASGAIPVTAKVRIDLAAGTVEAEGSEEFVRGVYNDFRDRVVAEGAPQRPAGGRGSSAALTDGGTTVKRAGAGKKSGAGRTSGATTRRDRTPVLVKDLDLATKGSRVGLKDFVKRYRKLTNALDLNTLFVYYLARVGEVRPITMDHVYTCYKHAGARAPKVLTQSLSDTSRKKGTVDTASLDDIKLTTTGENWVEHDLPKAEQAESDTD
jgi:hypothetical protein